MVALALLCASACSGDEVALTSEGVVATRGTSSSTGAAVGSEVSSVGSSSDSSDGFATGGFEGGEGTSGGDVPRFLHYIRSEPYPRLVIEVDRVEGRDPYPVAIDGIEHVLAETLDKPGGVEVVLDDVLPASPEADPGWSADAMRSLAEETFDLEVPDDTIKIHVLVLDGHAQGEGSTIFGLAWHHVNIVLFKDLYAAACADALLGPLQQPLCEQTEFLVWQHEIGHVLGLVDAGLPMLVDHRDPAGSLHDLDRACVMYAEYEGTDALLAIVDRLLEGAPPVEFDRNCLDDIEAVK